MSVVHETIVLERHYDATPARIFRAFADPQARAMWFPGREDWPTQEGATYDFREGGTETAASGPVAGEPRHRYTARYHDIVPDRRIVLCYEMVSRGARISVSVQSIELFADGDGTRLVLTDQGAYLDGLDNPNQRRRGLAGELDQLAKALTA